MSITVTQDQTLTFLRAQPTFVTVPERAVQRDSVQWTARSDTAVLVRRRRGGNAIRNGLVLGRITRDTGEITWSGAGCTVQSRSRLAGPVDVTGFFEALPEGFNFGLTAPLAPRVPVRSPLATCSPCAGWGPFVERLPNSNTCTYSFAPNAREPNHLRPVRTSIPRGVGGSIAFPPFDLGARFGRPSIVYARTARLATGPELFPGGPNSLRTLTERVQVRVRVVLTRCPGRRLRSC
jgi:hypothetical protein